MTIHLLAERRQDRNMQTESNKTRTGDLARAFKATLPVMTGYLVLGMGFGIVMQSCGYGTLWSFAEAVFIYAGTMQFAAVELLRSGASLMTVALTTLAVNARHLFYGISMLERYRDAGRGRWYLVFSLTDETYSLLCSDDALDRVQNKTLYYFTVSILDHLYWITGCTAGGLLDQLIRFETTGADFALTALFVSVFTGQWKGTKDHFYSLTGVLCALGCLVIFGSDYFLIPSMILTVFVLMMHARRSSDEA